MDYEKMFKELVSQIDKGYILARRVIDKDIPIEGTKFSAMANNGNYMNGVLGAYLCMERKIDVLYGHKRKE